MPEHDPHRALGFFPEVVRIPIGDGDRSPIGAVTGAKFIVEMPDSRYMCPSWQETFVGSGPAQFEHVQRSFSSWFGSHVAILSDLPGQAR